MLQQAVGFCSIVRSIEFGVVLRISISAGSVSALVLLRIVAQWMAAMIDEDVSKLIPFRAVGRTIVARRVIIGYTGAGIFR